MSISVKNVRASLGEEGNDPTPNVGVQFWVTGQKKLGNTVSFNQSIENQSIILKRLRLGP